MRLLLFLSTLILLSGCSTYGKVENEQLNYHTNVTELYSLGGKITKRNSGDYSVFVAMSGGGTRAAALSYGVLKGLKELELQTQAGQSSLLDEIDFISSVSGGSFTAAYYGLYGDKLFTDFENDFLYNDIGSDLFWRLWNPGLWFSFSGRTEQTVAYYQDRLFKGATFADFDQANSPLVIINATDLSRGVRFSFTQEYFNLLCSNISTYPVANAVTASSAVPIMFNPIVLKNHSGCGNQALLDLEREERANYFTQSTRDGLKSYSDKGEREYIHLVDGGITDNLGLLAIYDIINVSDEHYIKKLQSAIKPQLVAISIDASTKPDSAMDHSPKEPSLADTINFMTDVQVHRLNEVSRALYRYDLQNFEKTGATTTYFVNISLSDIEDPVLKQYLNNIPTDLELEAEQVDALIAEGMRQVRENPEIARFLRDTNQM